MKKNIHTTRTAEFYKIYKEQILPIFRSYEVYRKRVAIPKVFGTITVTSFILVFILLIAMVITIIFIPDYSSVVMFASTGNTLLLILLAKIGYHKGNKIKKFKQTLKQDCLPRLLKVFGDVEWKNNENIISDSVLDSCGLFAHFNLRTIDDEFVGTHHGVSFKITETELISKSGSGRNEKVIPIFKGVVIVFDSNKKIKHRTIIATKGDITEKNAYLLSLLVFATSILTYFAGSGTTLNMTNILIAMGVFVVLALFAKLMPTKEPLDAVNLEDSVFSEQFNVYSSDQVEARYLVTPAFMERFRNLNTAFGAKKAKCSFYKDKIIFAISTYKNLFEIDDMNKSFENPDTINTFYNELSSIYEMVEYFKLDEKVGL